MSMIPTHARNALSIGLVAALATLAVPLPAASAASAASAAASVARVAPPAPRTASRDVGPATKVPVSAAPAVTYSSTLGNYDVITVASNLVHPWSVALLPDGSFLVTERGGNLRRISAAGVVSAPLSGVPAVFSQGQGGLLDVVLAPSFATDQRIYFSFAEPGPGGVGGTAVASATLGSNAISNVQVLIRQLPKLSGGNHFGSRIVIDRNGDLLVTMGERDRKVVAQSLDYLQGKVIRIHPDGTIPADNPFMRSAHINRAIYSYGHRNPQAAALDPRSGRYWEAEHGPQGGDEINRPEPGRNYGWPVATYGREYGTGNLYPETYGDTAPGTEPPYKYWPVSPGLSGMAFLTARPTSAWNDNLFLGALAQRNLIRLTLDGEQIVGEERLLTQLNARIRDVRSGSDGNLYVLTDEVNGQLLKLVPPAR